MPAISIVIKCPLLTSEDWFEHETASSQIFWIAHTAGMYLQDYTLVVLVAFAAHLGNLDLGDKYGLLALSQKYGQDVASMEQVFQHITRMMQEYKETMLKIKGLDSNWVRLLCLLSPVMFCTFYLWILQLPERIWTSPIHKLIFISWWFVFVYLCYYGAICWWYPPSWRWSSERKEKGACCDDWLVW